MAFPYLFATYSSPTATPQMYSWELDNAPMRLATVCQQQHPLTPIAQPHPLTPISPPLYQQLQEPTQPQEEQQQQQQQQQQSAYQPPQMIHVPERIPTNRYRFDTITQEEFMQLAENEGRASEPPSSRRTSATRSAHSSPGASTASSTLPMRSAPGQHAQGVHPYRRPQSESAAGRADPRLSPAETAGMRPALDTEAGPRARAANGSGRAVSLPAAGLAVSCPAVNLWRDKLVRLPSMSGTAGSNSPTAATPASPGLDLQGLSNLPASPPLAPRRFNVCTDMQYDPTSNVLLAMLELPGVKKTDVHITLATCPYSRAKLLTVSGTSRQLLPPDRGHTVRERKSGEFVRSIAVPPETSIQDVHAIMEDGILTLRIPCGRAVHAEPPQDVPIA